MNQPVAMAAVAPGPSAQLAHHQAVADAVDTVERIALPVLLAPLGDHRPWTPELDAGSLQRRRDQVQNQYFRLSRLDHLGHGPGCVGPVSQGLTSSLIVYSTAGLVLGGSDAELLERWVHDVLSQAVQVPADPPACLAVRLCLGGLDARAALASAGVACGMPATG